VAEELPLQDDSQDVVISTLVRGGRQVRGTAAAAAAVERMAAKPLSSAHM
jgi:hypothetical protein